MGSCTIRRMTDWKNVLLEGEPIQAFLDFADVATADLGTDGSGTIDAYLPIETARSLERAIDRRALRLRGEDMIRASREGTAIRTRAQARCDAFMELVGELHALVAQRSRPTPAVRRTPDAVLRSRRARRHR